VQRGSARGFELAPAGDPLRNTLARECELTREVIRLNCELLNADFRAIEARLALRFTLMVIAWGAATAVLIINR
jgi:hypothetical protein